MLIIDDIKRRIRESKKLIFNVSPYGDTKIKVDYILRLSNEVNSRFILTKSEPNSYVRIKDTLGNYSTIKSDTIEDDNRGVVGKFKSKTLHTNVIYDTINFLSLNDGNYFITLMNEWDRVFKEVRLATLTVKLSKLSSDWDDLTSGKRIYEKKYKYGYNQYDIVNKDSTDDNILIYEHRKSKKGLLEQDDITW